MTQLFSLLKKDFLLLLRARHWPLAVFSFALCLLVLSAFALRQIAYSEAELLALSSGLLWLELLFASVVALNASFSFEREGEALLGLVLSGINPAVLYLAKVLSNFLFLLLLGFFIFSGHFIFFGLHLSYFSSQLFLLLPVVVFGISALGTLLSAMVSCVPARELLFSILFYPLLVPILGAAAMLTAELFQAGSFEFQSFIFKLILGLDFIFLLSGGLLFEQLIWE